MITVDPKDLIDIPGAGRAEVACRAAGAWDEERAEDAAEWSVDVYAAAPVVWSGMVRAVSEEDARRIAIAKAHAEGRWENNGEAKDEMAIARVRYRE